MKAVNTEANPDNVVPAPGTPVRIDGGKASVVLPALSWNVMKFKK